MISLSVNVNKIATLRNSRGGDEPNVVRAARVCIAAGCQGITVHPRADQRHIKPGDVRDLAAMLTVEFNIEGDVRPDLIDLVLEVKPTQCTLVPTDPGEVTSHRGWDMVREGPLVRPAIRKLKDAGIRVSLFMDPDAAKMKAAADAGADRVELYTAPYAWAKSAADIDREFGRLQAAHDAALAAGMTLNAGHDLNLTNLPRLQKLHGIKEVSIGHAIICHALDVGLSQAVKDFRRACGQKV
ncbi:MAG TPA: pyridoxine 5'-phosphate synthase [Candidatus Brocadiia bacterium]|nr:pyridoxine 5'-phosphate synthase [Candidatus Brocadiia bacterium]